MDDDAAIILMVDSNLQRETLLPSERAFAYRMKMGQLNIRERQPRRNLRRSQEAMMQLEKKRALVAIQCGDISV